VTQLILLDCEAVQALGDRSHRKHSVVLARVLDVAERKTRKALTSVAVPAAVRGVAGWDRTAPVWAFANRLRITDIPLDAAHANAAAGIRGRIGVSVADAHLGAAIQSAAADQVTVLSSDPHDMRIVAEDRRITIIAI